MIKFLISPGYGAGWSTWANEEQQKFLIFDKTLIGMAERQALESEVEKYLEEVFGKENGIYLGGWGDVEVHVLPEGSRFRIEEYDGSESVRTFKEDDYFTAGE